MPLRRNHKVSEKLFIDYARQTIPVVGLSGNEIKQARVLVALSEAGNYTRVEVAWTQSLPDRTASQV